MATAEVCNNSCSLHCFADIECENRLFIMSYSSYQSLINDNRQLNERVSILEQKIHDQNIKVSALISRLNKIEEENKVLKVKNLNLDSIIDRISKLEQKQ
jgi:hypothetical protein